MSKALETKLAIVKNKCDDIFNMLMDEEDEVMYAKLLGEYNTALNELASLKKVASIVNK